MADLQREEGGAGLQIDCPATPAQFDEYFDLRWRVLRAPWNQPRGSERDEFDAAADHVTARDPAGRLVGIGRLHMGDGGEARIRYMATEADCRGRGVGRAVLKRLEQRAAAHGASRIVLNAREPAAGFYARAGYRVAGPGPTLFGEIRHLRMEKRLSD